MASWMDEIGEIAPGITGFMAHNEGGIDVVALSSDDPQKGNFSRFLDSLQEDRRVTFHDVGNNIVRISLLKRGFNVSYGHSSFLNKDCENYVREPDDPAAFAEIGTLDVEIRFDSFTFKDLPEPEQESLQKVFEASPI